MQYILDTVTQALIGLLVMSLLFAVTVIRDSLEKWLEARTTVQQRETLHRIAKEGFALAEAAFKGAGGEKKLQEAEQYVLAHLGKVGVSLTAAEIRAAIERAVLEYNAATKPTEYIVREMK